MRCGLLHRTEQVHKQNTYYVEERQKRKPQVQDSLCPVTHDFDVDYLGSELSSILR